MSDDGKIILALGIFFLLLMEILSSMCMFIR